MLFVHADTRCAGETLCLRHQHCGSQSALVDLPRGDHVPARPGHHIDNRPHNDAVGLQAVIIGGGYIGMEIAASLANNGAEATIVFPEPFLLSR